MLKERTKTWEFRNNETRQRREQIFLSNQINQRDRERSLEISLRNKNKARD